MKYNRLSRRMFLQGAGSTVLAVPFLPSLFSSTANAAGVVLPKYVHINSAWGLPREHAYPLYLNPMPPYPAQPKGTNPNSVPWILKDADTKYQSLAQIIAYQGQISYVFDKDWNGYAPKMNLITNAHAYVGDNKFTSGVSGCASSNANGTVPSDNANGPAKGYAYSVDALTESFLYRASSVPALKTIRMNPGKANYPSEQFGSFCFNTVNGVDTRVQMMKTLAELGAALGAGSGSAGGVSSGIRQTRIDSVLGDFKKLMNHRRISSDDKQRLSQAADMWSKIDSNLANGGAASCKTPTLNAAETNWALIHNAAMDAITLALACGVTRNVAYGIIQYGDAVYDAAPEPNLDGTIDQPYFTQSLKWRSQRVLYMLAKLAAFTDENGQSLLDSTLVAWAHNTGGSNHDMLGHTLLSVGGAQGKLETGWHVDAGAAPVNRFHLTNMMALGLSLSDIERSGRAGFGELAAQTIQAAGGVSTGERDYKTNDPEKRAYDYSKRDHFATSVEMRKAFPYLKA